MGGNWRGFGEEIKKLCKKCVIYACLSGAMGGHLKQNDPVSLLIDCSVQFCLSYVIQ